MLQSSFALLQITRICNNSTQIKLGYGAITMRVLILVVFSILFTGCSNFNNIEMVSAKSKHPLKSEKDIKIENALTAGEWKYERQADDCKDTNWSQTFYKNRYYKSVGAACLVPNAFTVDAENWHTKGQILYVTNLSPKNGDDIILKYGIDYLDENKLVLSSGKYKYTFLR
jgi:hypothetical protein